jgi:hypothetical protein|tara:strand:- start:579 stop:872 length:294 start_codon:yes stop_codon:yes gene_type:complete
MTVENVVEELVSLTPIELRQVASIIKDLIDNAETPSDINVGDLVSFEIRDGCTLTGLVESTTAKRASVLLNAVEGSYTIDLKKVAIMVAAPISEEEE